MLNLLRIEPADSELTLPEKPDLPTPLTEKELRTGVQNGGRIRDVFLVARGTRDDREYVAYLRLTWRRGLFLFRTRKVRTDKTYRNPARLLDRLWDDFGYARPVPVYMAGAPELARHKTLDPLDRVRADPAEPLKDVG